MLADTEVKAFNAGGVDLPAAGREPLLDGLQGSEDHAVAHPHQAPPAHGLDHLCLAQLRQWHPARLGVWPFVLAAGRLHPVSIVGQQGGHILPKAIRQEEGHTVGRSHLGDLMDHALRHRQRTLAHIDGQQQLGDGVHRRPHPMGRP